MTPLKRTPLYDAQIRLGARMVDFGGFELPVQYTSIRGEHTAVRHAAGLFDISHMGQIELSGPDAIAQANHLFSRDIVSLRPGRIRYGLLCNEAGGVVDDVTCYRLADDALFFCVNAANIDKDFEWISRHTARSAGVRNLSEDTGMLALQGPASKSILQPLATRPLDAMRRYAFERFDVAGCAARVSRTGYTGAPGYEIYLAASDTEHVFNALLEAGSPLGLQPAGLGARDTLRVEAALPLYGNELDDETTPLEAGLEKFVDLDGPDFIGAEALRRQRRDGPRRHLIGFELEGRGVARAGYPVAVGSDTVGHVTSGCPSPTLGKSIGLAYVSNACDQPGSRFDIIIRDRPVAARRVETPFVKATT